MAPPCIEITYAAHTASCTFLLDAEGICRRIVMAPKGKRSAGRTAARCVGAQYVASLDGSAAGGLVEMPRVGSAMLFARVDERGRVSLVRTGVVESFESHAGEDPFRESASVETSAPVLNSDLISTPENPEARQQHTFRAPSASAPDDYYEASDRTQRIQALRPQDVAAALDDMDDEPVESQELATAQYYAAQPEPAPLPMPRPMPTLRAQPRDPAEEDAYSRPQASPARGILPRRSNRSDPRIRAQAAARSYAPPAQQSEPRPAPRASDVQIARRRRI